ncbi:MAG: TonB-dependent receptor [candidate division KSB1 bacterium]|nr:TonB-dependent receptor [candidate division KSB1 bacterium]
MKRKLAKLTPPLPFVSALLLLLTAAFPLHGGVTGSIAGYVIDAQSKKALAGVHIIVEDTELTGVTDKKGYYIINNIPAGIYSLRTQMIGYAPIRMNEVVVKTDLTTRIDFELKLTAFLLDPEPQVVVTAKRFSVAQEAQSRSFYLDHQRITQKLPVDQYLDTFKFLPGIYGSHFRGGRSRDITFLLDGIPIISPLTRGVAINIPISAISEILVHTGGFSSEYGNAVAGVVNIISRRGRNNFLATGRTYTDDIGLNQVATDHTRRYEIGFGGPMAISFGGPVVEMNYFIAADIGVTSPQQNLLEPFFRDFKKINFNLLGVYDVRLSRNTRLSLQGIYNQWRWRGVDTSLPFEPSAVPLRKNKRSRITLRFTHTLSPSMFYYISAGYSKFSDSILGERATDYPPVIQSDQLAPAKALQLELAPWWQKSEEAILYIDASVLKQLTSRLQFKGGVQGEYYDLKLDALRYIPQPNKRNKTVYHSRFASSFHRFPRYIAGFFEFNYESSRLRAKLGGRVDYVNANAPGPERPIQDSLEVRDRAAGKYTFSPRLSVALSLNRYSQISLNYGHSVQIAPFYYYYAGENTTAEDAPLWPLKGSTELKPTMSRHLEFSFLRSISETSSISVTSFWRKYADLIDTNYFPFNVYTTSAKQVATFYQNQATSRARGVEIELRHALSDRARFRLVYTYMQAQGTSNMPEEEYFQFVNFGFVPTAFDRPLNWDQRHSFILETTLRIWSHFEITAINRTYSPREWLKSTLSVQEYQKLPWRNLLDIRLNYSIRARGFAFRPFFEIRNALDTRSSEELDHFYLIDNQPLQPFEDLFGRRIRLGIQIN